MAKRGFPEVATVEGTDTPLGFRTLTVSTTAVGFGDASGGIPDGTRWIKFTVVAQPVRFRDDGTNPTAAVGYAMAAAYAEDYTADDLTKAKFIRSGGTDSTVEFRCYG